MPRGRFTRSTAPTCACARPKTSSSSSTFASLATAALLLPGLLVAGPGSPPTVGAIGRVAAPAEPSPAGAPGSGAPGSGAPGSGAPRSGAPRSGKAPAGRVAAVGAENEYADVISQVGGRYVSVAAIMSNPNTDPHEFEASAAVAETVSRAQLIVQNGVGYDSFMDKLEAATPHEGRQVVVVQDLLHISPDAFNPHLWYDPRAMPAVAEAVARDLSRVEPAHAAYFEQAQRRFDLSLQPWLDALAQFKREHGGTPVAVTEPVADYMLEAVGADIKTPPSLQSAIMNGTDPSPQDISTEAELIADRKVKVLVYNQQVTDSLTTSFLAAARTARVPVVGVYETMPVPGYDYQSWMLAELDALQGAVTKGASTVRL